MALDFIAGCIGGCAGVIVGHPLDTVKVNLQTQDPKNPKYTSTYQCLKSIFANEGIRGLYRGVRSPLTGVAGINAIVFGVYGNIQRRSSDPDSLRSHAIAGGTAGLFQSFICSPMELAKSRSQVSKSVLDCPIACLKCIYKTEGCRAVFKGLPVTMIREVPAFSSYFLTYELLTKDDSGKPTSTMKMLVAGGIAGTISWTLTYPIDVIKTRYQIDGITSSKYNSTIDCLKKSVSSEGYRFLFKGLTPTLLRAFPVNAVTFAVVTWTMRIFSGDFFSVTAGDTESIFETCTNVVITLNMSENISTS